MLTSHLIEAMLAADSSPSRFEDFCNEILATDLGITVVSTSKSWDLGRDGRSISTSRTFVATSLRKDVEVKTLADVGRIASKASDKPITLYVCSSVALSEAATDAIADRLRAKLPTGSDVHPLGANHLAQLGRKHPEVIERLYKGELDDVRRLLTSSAETTPQAEEQALRLALMTAGSPDTALLRAETYRAAINSVLSDGRPRTIGELARDVSHGFRLTRLLPQDVLSPIVQAMANDGEIATSENTLRLAETGRVAAEKATDRAAEALLSGRRHIRERVEAALGNALTDQQFESVWRSIQDATSKAFYQRGLELVAAVTTLINGGEPDQPATALPFIDELAAACSLVTSHAEQREEIRTAVVDLFREPVGPAFEWLVQLCAGFVTVCSLGLEAQSGARIAEILGRFVLVLDTDVTLSLLCEGEPDHDATIAIQQRMKVLGGQLRTASGVVREVYHHARIADPAFGNVAHWLPGSREERLRLIDNAFVRGFAELVAKRRAKIAQWPQYMSQYNSRRQGEGVLDVLESEFDVHMIPEENEASPLCQEVRAYVARKLPLADNPRDRRILADKAKRDASLYCDMVAFIQDLRDRNLDKECLLVSSGRRLADLEEHFRKFGTGHFVVNVPAVLQLLSLVPGVSLHLGALRAYLFEGAKFRSNDDLEKLVLRVMKDAGNIDLPFAKRKFLAREVKRRLIESADNVSRRPRSSRDAARALVKAASQPAAEGSRAAEILVGALEASATWSKKDEEIARLRKELEAGRRRR